MWSGMKRLATWPNVLYSTDIICFTSDLGESFILLAKTKRCMLFWLCTLLVLGYGLLIWLLTSS